MATALLLTLKNVSDLRKEWGKELKPKRKTKRSLELLRILFKFVDLMKLKHEFMERLGEIIPMGNPSVSASKVAESINNCYYDISEETMGGITVKLIFHEKQNFNLPDSNLLLQKCEEIVLVLMEALNKPKETESGTLVDRTILESFRKLIHDGESTSAHYQEKDKPFNGVSSSLCYKKEKGYERQPVTHTEETARNEEPHHSSSCTQYAGANCEQQKKHATFVKENKPKLWDESCERWINDKASDYIFTYHDKESNEIKYRFFEDEQETFSWAHKKNVFFKVWELDNENSSNLNSNDLMTNKQEEMHPMISDILITNEGSERQPGTDTEKTTGTEVPNRSKEFSKHREEMIKLYEQHENFFEEEKNKELFEEKFYELIEKKETSDHVFPLTYHNKDSNKIDYEFFEEEQKALWWAHENIERMGGDIKFIVVRRLIGENFSRLTTDDLMTNEVKLTSPLKPDIVITKVCTYDSAADIATVPFHPTMKQTFIHSVTTLNQELHLTVYGQLTINERKLKKIYKIELDPDKTWCAIGNPQIADLPEDEVEKILARMKRVIFEKKDQIAMKN